MEFRGLKEEVMWVNCNYCVYNIYIYKKWGKKNK